LARNSVWTKTVALMLLGASVVMLALRCPLILLMVPLWLAGVLVRSLPRIRLPSAPTMVGSFTLLCAALIVSSTQWNWLGDFAVGIATALFIYVLRSMRTPRGRWTVLAHHLASFSFSLYAVHYPLNLFLFSWFGRERVTHAGPKEWLLWSGIVLLEAAFCWVFYWIFERRTPSLRRALLRLVSSAGIARPGSRSPAIAAPDSRPHAPSTVDL
jgi:peptidoglycan/LPS O-acetylase OafA/YrhL